ncbi:subtilisin-like protein [Hypoxylon sp. FL1857]|nr:subtilisin-like protein [Hypoxylon sp. FL1857]
MRAIIGEAVEHIEKQNFPVLWAFKPIHDEDASSVGEITVIDILKSLILQAVQSPQVSVTESQSNRLRGDIQYAKKEEDWLRLFSSSLANFQLVCIVIDNETSTQSANSSSPLTTRWPAMLAKILEEHRQESSKTVIKAILTGYDSALSISKWRDSTVKSLATWAEAPDQSTNKRREASRFALPIKLPLMTSIIQARHERDTLTNRGNSPGAQASIDDATSQAPVTIGRSRPWTALASDIGVESGPALSVSFTGRTREPQHDYKKESSIRVGSFSSEQTDAINGAYRAKQNAQMFTEDFKQFLRRFMEPKETKACRSDRSRIKIALLDTGIRQATADGGLPNRRNATMEYREKQGFDEMSDINPIKRYKSFLEKGKGKVDDCGHGTQLACLLLEFAPDADLYIARVSSTMEFDDPGPIAEAIRWAASEVHADIITMSFGWDYHVQEVSEAIDDALKEKTERGHKPLLFASASNHGLRNPNRSFPAWDSSRIICAYALDGLGADTSTINPPTMDHCSNFGTLGHGVEVTWNNKIEYKSGTSYATPFLAALTANYLDWLDHHASTLGEKKYKLAREKSWIEQAFRDFMSVKKEPLSRMGFVAPWHFFKFNAHNVPNSAAIPDEVKEMDKRTDISCVEIIRAGLPPT